jgi:hypothetical protein
MHWAESSASMRCPCMGPQMLRRTAAEMMARSVTNRYSLLVSSSVNLSTLHPASHASRWQVARALGPRRTLPGAARCTASPR